ncbi:MAG: hypothetical protein ACRC7P_00940, partial [Enterovibrio sp.]
MQPKNQNEMQRSDLFTRCQLSQLLDGCLDDRVYGSLQNTVMALKNSPVRPATQGATASSNQLNMLVEKIDLQLSLLEVGDARASGEELPSLEDINLVRTALMEYESASKYEDAAAALLREEGNAQGSAATDFRRRLTEQKELSNRAFSRADMARQRALAFLTDTRRSELARVESTQISEQKETTQTEFLLKLDSLLGANEALTVSDLNKKHLLFLQLYSMILNLSDSDIPQNVGELLHFLLPPSSNKASPLLLLQIILGALRGLNRETEAKVSQLLNMQIARGLTFEMLTSRKASGNATRGRFLLQANTLTPAEQKLAILKFTKVIMGITHAFLSEYKSIDADVEHRAAAQ